WPPPARTAALWRRASELGWSCAWRGPHVVVISCGPSRASNHNLGLTIRCARNCTVSRIDGATKRRRSVQRGLLFGIEPLEFGAAPLLGGGLELAAGGVDVAAARGAHRRADAGLEDNLGKASDPF